MQACAAQLESAGAHPPGSRGSRSPGLGRSPSRRPAPRRPAGHRLLRSQGCGLRGAVGAGTEVGGAARAGRRPGALLRWCRGEAVSAGLGACRRPTTRTVPPPAWGLPPCHDCCPGTLGPLDPETPRPHSQPRPGASQGPLRDAPQSTCCTHRRPSDPQGWLRLRGPGLTCFPPPGPTH